MLALASLLTTTVTSTSAQAFGIGYAMGVTGAILAKTNSKGSNKLKK